MQRRRGKSQRKVHDRAFAIVTEPDCETAREWRKVEEEQAGERS